MQSGAEAATREDSGLVRLSESEQAEFDPRLELPANSVDSVESITLVDSAESITLDNLFAEPAPEPAAATLDSEALTLTDLFGNPELTIPPSAVDAEVSAEPEIEASEAVTLAEFAEFVAESAMDSEFAAAPPTRTDRSVGAEFAELQPSATDSESAEAMTLTDLFDDFAAAKPAEATELTADSNFLVDFEPAFDQPVAEPLDVAALAVSEVEAVPEVAEPAPVELVNLQPVEPAQSAALLTPAVPELVSAGLDEAVLAQLDQLLAEPPPSAEPEAASDEWFLGVDIGTTGISAVLLNRQQYRLYPLYWQATSSEFPGRKQFRLSTAVTLLTDQARAFPLPTIRIEPSPNATQQTIAHWKLYLKLAVPHYSPQTSRWEPALQWTDQQTLPLRTLQEALQQLLTTLNPARASFMPDLTCGALGLEPEEFQAVLGKLQAVVVGYPSNWPDTYSLNVREAILQAELVPSPTQIVFLEEAIAALLSALPATDRRPIALAQTQGQSGHLHNADWQGITLILTAGTTMTELVMVNLPAQLQTLNPTDFYTRSLPLAGYSLDQDIIGQLLYPALCHLPEANRLDESMANSAEFVPDLILEQWDPHFDLTHLALEANDIPAAAELALTQRLRLQQRLHQTASGQTLLNLAHALKITLQFQPRFGVQWKTTRLVFDRQMLTSQVLLPYVQRLNRELNALLAQTNTTATAVKQVLCTGGTASLGAMTRWLRQKLPNATIVQDTYPQPATITQSCIPSCSRVAYGLAALPLHPQVIDQSRHRFNDYLLLKALLTVLPAQPTPVSTVMRLLEQQGIDTQACRYRILALLEGHLPPGLIPAESDLALLTPESASNPDYQAIRLTPLLLKHADRTYEPNPHVWAYLQQYLDTLLADTEQTLDQPLQPALTPLSQLNQAENFPKK